ncbi:hypothetical protein GCM10020331_056640 [Ectobacillus funiculus]
MYGIDLSIMQQITLLLVLMLTSKGMAGVPGASFVVILTTLGAMGLPLEGVAFIAGIDRIFGYDSNSGKCDREFIGGNCDVKMGR